MSFNIESTMMIFFRHSQLIFKSLSTNSFHLLKNRQNTEHLDILFNGQNDVLKYNSITY